MNADDWISMLQGKTSENYQKQVEEEKQEAKKEVEKQSKEKEFKK